MAMLPIASRCAIQYMFITLLYRFCFAYTTYDDIALNHTISHKSLFRMTNAILMCIEEELITV